MDNENLVYVVDCLNTTKVSILNLCSTTKGLILEFITNDLYKSSRETFYGTVLVLGGAYLYFRKKHSLWINKNVPGPKPIIFFGNALTFALRARVDIELEWAKRYGKLYGYYMVTKPVLVCADAGLLKKICIKDFDQFPNRLFLTRANKYQKHFLVIQQDDHWRDLRALLSPTFASGKIKRIFKLLDGCSDELIKNQLTLIEQQKDKKVAQFETRTIFNKFTLNSALNSFFGINLSSSSGDQGADTIQSFTEKLHIAFTMKLHRFMITSLVPKRILDWFDYPLFPDKPMAFFANRCKKIIEYRRKNNQKVNDFLQIIIDARANDANEVAESDQHEEHHALSVGGEGVSSKRSQSRFKLTEEEVIAQAMVFMMVSTETTSVLLSNTIYILANFEEIQEKLRSKLFEFLPSSNRFEYDDITTCEYLDCVISESLRFMSPAIYIDRITSNDYYLEDYDLRVPKGTTINLALHAIHHDPDYWPEPEKFDPTRFLKENRSNIVPGSYCPFGIGPRACIAFRFALTEVKIALAKMLTTFRYKRAPGTKFPPEPISTQFIINERKNMFVLVEPL